MNKRGQGLSITTIIVAAIALIVLVVLVAIFTGRLGGFNRGLTDVSTCESLGGARCTTSDNCASDARVLGASDCGKDLSQDGGTDKSSDPICCKS
jgi:hypothetical protein